MTNMNELILWQDRLDLLFAARCWPNTFGSKLAKQMQAPHEMIAEVIQAEINLLTAAQAQRAAIESVEQWFRQTRPEVEA